MSQKNDQAVPGLTFDSAEQHVPCGQQYSVDMVQRFVSLVTVCGTSLHCAASVITLYGPSARCDETAPDWSTGRLWLLRIGLAALLRPKVVAEDWVWMIDHSIQIGQCKCLVILGIRLGDFRRPAAVPSGHGIDCPGADDQRDQGDRGRVPGGCRVDNGRSPRDCG